jgi:RNA polymerase sigma factor (sigma-70 family)
MILKSRFFEEKTLNVVGAEMGITKERVRQIESRALERIRSKLKILNISFDDI